MGSEALRREEWCLVPIASGGPPQHPSAQRILDRFWVVPQADARRQEMMLAFLFDTLAERYTDFVDVPRNVGNIRRLVGLLGPPAQGRAHRVLDVGCGAGLSMPLVRELGIDIIGVDVSDTMRRLAVEAGLRVIDPQQLQAVRAGYFSGAFAAYVFHLDPQPSSLPEIMRVIDRGGVLAANFHKGMGYEEFASYASSLNLPVTVRTQGKLSGSGDVAVTVSHAVL